MQKGRRGQGGPGGFTSGLRPGQLGWILGISLFPSPKEAGSCMKCLSRMCLNPLTTLIQNVEKKNGGPGKYNGDVAA